MNITSTTPIKTWVTWSIIVLGAFLLLTWEYFVAGFSSDASKISHLLVLFFLYGFFSSLRTAIYLQKEFKGLSAMETSRTVPAGPMVDIVRLFSSVKELIDKGDKIDIRNLVSAYGVKLGVRIKNISVIAGMLITIGLLGTVIGLIITVGGLSTVLEASGNDHEAMIRGMTETVSGMGTAFYTTFFGALLGGVVLRVLGAEVEKSATQLAAQALELGELWLAPLCHEPASETLTQIEDQLQFLRKGLAGLGDSIGGVVDIIDAKQAALQDSMTNLVAEAEQSIADTLSHGVEQLSAGFTAISQNMEAGMAKVIDATAQTMAQGSDHLASGLATISQTMEQGTADLASGLASVSQTMEQGTAGLASGLASVSQSMEQGTEKLADGFAAISENMEQGMAKVVADAEKSVAQTMEKGLGELSTGLTALSQTMEQAQQPLNEGLSCLAANVEEAVVETRRQSDAQLQMRASDIAQKLNGAADLLTSLCPSGGDAE